MFIYLPVLVLFIGVVLYLFTDHPKVSEVARAMMWCGLLVTLFQGFPR
jgi:Na+-driven multidrug efflux pump